MERQNAWGLGNGWQAEMLEWRQRKRESRVDQKTLAEQSAKLCENIERLFKFNFQISFCPRGAYLSVRQGHIVIEPF